MELVCNKGLLGCLFCSTPTLWRPLDVAEAPKWQDNLGDFRNPDFCKCLEIFQDGRPDFANMLLGILSTGGAKLSMVRPPPRRGKCSAQNCVYFFLHFRDSLERYQVR